MFSHSSQFGLRSLKHTSRPIPSHPVPSPRSSLASPSPEVIRQLSVDSSVRSIESAAAPIWPMCSRVLNSLVIRCCVLIGVFRVRFARSPQRTPQTGDTLPQHPPSRANHLHNQPSRRTRSCLSPCRCFCCRPSVFVCLYV